MKGYLGFLAWLGLTVALSGCSLPQPSAASQYYLLSSSPLPPHAPGDVAGRFYVVGPLNFADYLQRSSVVTQLSDHQYEVAKLEHWGGKIEDEFQIALMKNLAALKPASRFLRYPSLVSFSDVVSLRADVLRFDHRLGGDARLEVSWAWVHKNNDILAAGLFSMTSPAGNSIETAVAAQSELVRLFAEELSKPLP